MKYLFMGMIMLSLNACTAEKMTYKVIDSNVLLKGKVVYTQGFSERYYSINFDTSESALIDLPEESEGVYHFTNINENNIIIQKKKEGDNYQLTYYDYNTLHSIKSITVNNCIENKEFYVDIINGKPYVYIMTPHNRTSRYYCDTVNKRAIHYNYKCRFVGEYQGKLIIEQGRKESAAIYLIKANDLGKLNSSYKLVDGYDVHFSQQNNVLLYTKNTSEGEFIAVYYLNDHNEIVLDIKPAKMNPYLNVPEAKYLLINRPYLIYTENRTDLYSKINNLYYVLRFGLLGDIKRKRYHIYDYENEKEVGLLLHADRIIIEAYLP